MGNYNTTEKHGNNIGVLDAAARRIYDNYRSKMLAQTVFHSQLSISNLSCVYSPLKTTERSWQHSFLQFRQVHKKCERNFLFH